MDTIQMYIYLKKCNKKKQKNSISQEKFQVQPYQIRIKLSLYSFRQQAEEIYSSGASYSGELLPGYNLRSNISPHNCIQRMIFTKHYMIPHAILISSLYYRPTTPSSRPAQVLLQIGSHVEWYGIQTGGGIVSLWWSIFHTILHGETIPKRNCAILIPRHQNQRQNHTQGPQNSGKREDAS